MKDLTILSGLVMLYCFFHSFLISITVTRYVKSNTGEIFRYYRLFFNIFSLVTLIPLLYYTHSLRGSPVFIWSGYLVYIKYAIIMVGIILIMAGTHGYNFFQFLGLKQLKNSSIDENDIISETLNTSGVLSIIRDPWYAAVILLLWARNMDYSKLVVNTIFTGYIIIGTYLEEYKLVKAFGKEYLDYQKEVSMLIPVKWVFKKLFS